MSTRAYLCVYRHPMPKPRERQRTAEVADDNPLLRRYLDVYDTSYYDWGDAPGFFAATELLGKPALRDVGWPPASRRSNRAGRGFGLQPSISDVGGGPGPLPPP
jgi:hypothetical protein